MIRTITSIFVTIGLLFGVSFYEARHVTKEFENFRQALDTLHKKTESGIATYEDGDAVRTYWEKQKDTLHVWLPHTALQEIDYQLNEAVGYIYVNDFEGALPKIEVLLGLSYTIPHSYKLNWQNIF